MDARKLLDKWNMHRFQKDIPNRVILYDKIRRLTSNGNSISQAVDRLLNRYTRNPPQGLGVLYDKLIKKVFGADATTNPTEAYLRELKKEELKGNSIAEASKGGWVSKDEELILYAGEESGDIGSAMDKAVKLMEKIHQMNKDIKKEMNPIKILFVAITLVIFGVSSFLMPIMMEFGDPDDWNLISYSFYVFSTFFTGYIFYLGAGLLVIARIYAYAKPNLIGKGREVVEAFPLINIPFKIYNSIQSGLVISSIGGLMSSGVNLRESLVSVMDNSDKYAKKGVSEIIVKIDSGVNSGEALNSKFIGPIGEDIQDYAAASRIEDVLQRLGDQAIDDTVENILKYTGIAKLFMTFLIAGFMIWLLSSFMLIVMDMDFTGGM